MELTNLMQLIVTQGQIIYWNDFYNDLYNVQKMHNWKKNNVLKQLRIKNWSKPFW